MILLDTHVLLWFDTGSARLGTAARRACDAALQAGELAVSAMSFWEVAMLDAGGRFTPGRPISEWRHKFLDDGLCEVPVTGDVAIRATQLEGLGADPADRLITATAMVQGATLLTADRRMLEWRGKVQRQDATR